MERILEKRRGIRMAHLLTLGNDLSGVEWAFSKYDNSELEKIFTDIQEDIFDFAVDGRVEGKLVKLIFEKFEQSLVNEGSHGKRDRVNKKKRR